MNNILTQFSIKDLENLSGIKAHTIRIWEKRYGILTPNRTDSNIRTYTMQSLQKLLNVTLLYNSGLKISHIAKVDEEELNRLVLDKVTYSNEQSHYIDSLKVAMVNFDRNLFEYTYTRLIGQSNFRTVFTEIFIPLLQNIGFQWQSNSITPAHEHFISNLIMQKLHVQIERIQQNAGRIADDVFVLYLPMNEIHEFGLLYLHYELLLRGYHSIYLGQSVPTENLRAAQSLYPSIRFVSYLTVKPDTEHQQSYLEELMAQLRDSDTVYLLGPKTNEFKSGPDRPNLFLFNNSLNFLNIL